MANPTVGAGSKMTEAPSYVERVISINGRTAVLRHVAWRADKTIVDA